MEQNDLLRTEADENQNLNATPGASEEARENVAAAPAQESEPQLETQPEESTQPQTVAEQPSAENNSVADMMAEIENGNEMAAQEQEEEPADESEEESYEKIEAEYKKLSLEEAVEEFHRVVADTDYNKIKQRVSILRTEIINHLKEARKSALDAFIAEGGQKENFTPEVSPVEEKFNNAFQVFKNNKARFIENIEKEKQQNLEAKNNIIAELRTLVETESNLKILNDKYKELQEKWKAIGPVPQNESNNVWQNYHFYVEKFFDILRINRELKDLDMKKNLEEKLKLCEAAESLLLQDNINKSFKDLQDLHNAWKEIGPVPEDKKEELWGRFKSASDQINQRRREHYDEIFAQQQSNYNAKVVLCEKAEEFISQPTDSAKDFNTVSDQLTELLKVWKTLGAAPPKVNEEIWGRFKGALDKFFEKKKEFFGKVREEQQNNYNQKVDLAIRAEAIAQRTDWRTATEEILALQQEWKSVGPTARKHSEAIWKRFRAACDKFFEAKANYFSNAKEIESENLRLKEELIKRIQEHTFGADKSENLEAIKAYQREWTEIGFVPKKDKDRIYTEYREAIDKRFAELKVSMDERRHDNYRSKINNILSDPNAGHLIDKEKRYLVNKLEQLKNDIALWENNLGFFANSKNADFLKAEFTKKIDAAKSQVKDLEYKIKMMDKPKEE